MNKIIAKSVFFCKLAALLTVALWTTSASAKDFHDPPRDFLFGNHIDTHQETKLKTDKDGTPVSLSGYLYVFFPPGETDPASGLPIARHPRGTAENEVCGVDVDCVAGWLVEGVPAEATFLYHSGINGDDHPVWLLNRVDIPQPGSFTHFHWIASASTDPWVVENTVPEECDKPNAGELQVIPPESDNHYCPGWLLQVRAVKSFAFQHGGEIIPVYPGIDNATHLNIVTNYQSVSGITPTR